MTLDAETLTTAGHGYGGTTALYAAATSFGKVKACLPIDAMFAPFVNDLDTLVMEDTPIFHLRADDYYDLYMYGYDQRKVSEQYMFKVK